MDLIGKMRKVVYYCLNAPSQRGAGNKDNYGVLLTTRGYLKKQSGDRSSVFSEIEANTASTLIVRRQAAITGNLRIDNKFVIGNVWYTVTSWELLEDNLFIKFNVNKKEPVTAGEIDLETVTGEGLQDPLYLDTTPGATTVSSALLSGATILTVARSGLIYNKVAGVPGNFEFSFSGTTITFNTEFNADEKVYVLYAN